MTENALFVDPRTSKNTGLILAAANKTIEALETAGAVDETHALKIELIRSGARALDKEFAAPKLSVAAMQLFAKVTEVAEGLPTIQEAITDQFNQIAAALADAD